MNALLCSVLISLRRTCLELHKPSPDEGRAATLNIHCTPTLVRKISVEGEHILQCDVDLVSSPALHGLCFLC